MSTPEERWKKRVLVRTLAGWFINRRLWLIRWRHVIVRWLYGTNAGMVVLMFILILSFMAIAAIEQMDF